MKLHWIIVSEGRIKNHKLQNKHLYVLVISLANFVVIFWTLWKSALVNKSPLWLFSMPDVNSFQGIPSHLTPLIKHTVKWPHHPRFRAFVYFHSPWKSNNIRNKSCQVSDKCPVGLGRAPARMCCRATVGDVLSHASTWTVAITSSGTQVYLTVILTPR